jgi:hypothetical protein
MEKHELSQLESHIQTIRTAHQALARGSEMDELFKIIHNPEWTTPAEYAFLLASLESIKAQTAQLAGSSKACSPRPNRLARLAQRGSPKKKAGSEPTVSFPAFSKLSQQSGGLDSQSEDHSRGTVHASAFHY